MNMVYSITTQPSRVIVARMTPGEDVLKTLENIVEKYDIQGGQLTLIGAVSKAKLGYFDREERVYKHFVLEEDLEVVSGMGNIARGQDGKLVVHAHMIVSDETGKCYGGHLMEGCEVSVTIEVIIFQFNSRIQRSIEESTGLNMMYLE